MYTSATGICHSRTALLVITYTSIDTHTHTHTCIYIYSHLQQTRLSYCNRHYSPESSNAPIIKVLISMCTHTNECVCTPATGTTEGRKARAAPRGRRAHQVRIRVCMYTCVFGFVLVCICVRRSMCVCIFVCTWSTRSSGLKMYVFIYVYMYVCSDMNMGMSGV